MTRHRERAAVQKSRAREYAICTIALRYDRISAGAEGVFDQALTNGLAAIVGHMWPGREMKGSQVRSATGLLGVIVEKGTTVNGDVCYVPNSRDTEPDPSTIPMDDDPWPRYHTRVRIGVLGAAIDATQPIRHARKADRGILVSPSDEQIGALEELCHHPVLADGMDVLDNRYVLDVETVDKASIERAVQYLELLHDEELSRRATAEYWDMYKAVDSCPVCENNSLIVQGRDEWIDEISAGQCVVCGYCRTTKMANLSAQRRQVKRLAKGLALQVDKNARQPDPV